MHVIGDVDGRNVLILDDIIDTAGTLTKTVEALRAAGRPADPRRRRPRHPLRPGARAHRGLPLERVLVTNTTPVDDEVARCSKLRPCRSRPLLGEAIRRIHENSSVSSLFV